MAKKLINSIENRINFYKNGLGQTNVKLVIKSDVYNKLKSETADKIIANSESAEEKGGSETISETIFGVPIEINDKIEIDYYITEVIPC